MVFGEKDGNVKDQSLKHDRRSWLLSSKVEVAIVKNHFVQGFQVMVAKNYPCLNEENR